MPYLEETEEVRLAFSVLAGECPLPLGTDRTAALRYHRAVLRAAMDRAWQNAAARNPARPHSIPRKIDLGGLATDMRHSVAKEAT